MNEEDVHTQLYAAKRNILSLNEGLKLLAAQRQKDFERMQHLETQVAIVTSQMQSMQQDLAVSRARNWGSGPTG